MAKNQTPFSVENPFSEEGEQYRPHALIYGHSGVGKSGFALTAPRPLFLDFENGATVTARAVGNRDARIVRVESMRTVRQVYKFLKEEDHEFLTVVLDPIADLQRLLMEDALERYPQKRAFGRIATMQDWNLVTDDFRKLIDAFRALPVHTILVAHAQPRDHEEDVVTPMISGKQMLSYAQRSVDLLGYMRTEVVDGEPERQLVTRDHPNIAAKNRGNFLPAVVPNPNAVDVFRTMMGLPESEPSAPAPTRSKSPKKGTSVEDEEG